MSGHRERVAPYQEAFKAGKGTLGKAAQGVHVGNEQRIFVQGMDDAPFFEFAQGAQQGGAVHAHSVGHLRLRNAGHDAGGIFRVEGELKAEAAYLGQGGARGLRQGRVHGHELDAQRLHEVGNEPGVAAYEVLVVEQGIMVAEGRDIACAVELGAAVEKAGGFRAQGVGHVEERAALHLHHGLHLSVGSGVENGHSAFLEKIEVVPDFFAGNGGSPAKFHFRAQLFKILPRKVQRGQGHGEYALGVFVRHAQSAAT